MREAYRATENFRTKKFWLAGLAEAVGVAIVVSIGCGSMLVGNYDSYPHYEPMDEPEKAKLFMAGKLLRVSIAFGLAVATATWTVFHMSGANLNPAITVGLLTAGRISLIRALLYIVAQLCGALLGVGVLYLCIPIEYHGNFGSTVLSPNVDQGRGAVIELVSTFVVVFTYCASTDKYRIDLGGSVPLTVGLAVLVCHLFALPLTTSSLNPARSFAPAVISGVWKNHWVYWLGPIVGAACSALLYKLAFSAEAIQRDYTTTSECPLIVTTAPAEASGRNPFESPADAPITSPGPRDPERQVLIAVGCGENEPDREAGAGQSPGACEQVNKEGTSTAVAEVTTTAVQSQETSSNLENPRKSAGTESADFNDAAGTIENNEFTLAPDKTTTSNGQTQIVQIPVEID